MTSALWPIEYRSIKRIPQNRLPSPATMASKAISTGVEHGEEKTPPRTPARKAPAKPRFLLLKSRLVEGMKLNISQVCRAISTINTPRTIYQTEDDVPMAYTSRRYQ